MDNVIFVPGQFLSTLSLRRATPSIFLHCTTYLFLSTLSLRRATANSHGERQGQHISIHALLAESDGGSVAGNWQPAIFLSTLSLRRATRPKRLKSRRCVFLSTLSLRRATNTPIKTYNIIKISIHALLAESDSARPEIRRPCAISIHALLAESDGLDGRFKL